MTKRVHSDTAGNVEGFSYADDEICLILSETTRVALLQFFDKTSRNDMLVRGLTDDQAQWVENFRHLLD